LKSWLPSGKFGTIVEEHLRTTDNEVLAGLRDVYEKPDHPGYTSASSIIDRKHFKLLYERNPTDQKRNPKAAKAIYDAACAELGQDALRFDPYDKAQEIPDFPVLGRDGRISSSLSASAALARVPVLAVDFVFARRDVFVDSEKWLRRNREAIIGSDTEEDE
jgi:hypothetical protein